MSAATLLVLTSLLMAALWVGTVHRVARRERPDDPAFARGWAFKALALLVALTGTHLWLAAQGLLGDFERKPPVFVFLMPSILAMSIFVATSRLGAMLARQLSFEALTGFQAFRYLAELSIFLAVREGIAPVQMSFEGYNPDIWIATLAVISFFVLRRRAHRGLVVAFNLLGVASLLIILFVAVTSMPLPVRLFMNEPSNVWVTQVPYVLLPSVLVTAAITAHLVSWRKLRMTRH